MSAAEKLKGLDTLTLKNEHNVPIRSFTVAEQLVDALPQIVAVVEAAERIAAQAEGSKEPENHIAASWVAARIGGPLAALEEAL